MKRFNKILSLLLVLAIMIPGIVSAVPVTESKLQSENAVERLAGETRVETAIEASKQASEKADTVILVGYNGVVDALTGTILAHAEDAPVLLTLKDEVPVEVKDELKRLRAKDIIVIGGKNVVSDKAIADLKGYSVKRIDGLNRAETAVNVAKEVSSDTNHVFLALGYEQLADALAIGPVSARENSPVLLTQTDKLPEETLRAMEEMNVTHVTIIGGDSAVNKNVERALRKYKVNRVSGDRREDTALEIAAKYFPKAKTALVAYGWKYADALVGGYLGANLNAPILLTNQNTLSKITESYLENNISNVFVLGGENVISKNIFTLILKLLNLGEETSILEINLLATTDMHGRMYTKSALTGKDVHNSMPKIAAVSKAEKAKNPNTILIDNGDTIQGTAETSYFITQKPEEINPMMHAMRLVGYDAWILGNHEFNYPWPIMKNIYDYIQSDTIKDGDPVEIINANLVVKDIEELRKVDGEDALTKEVGESYFSPYIIKEFKTENDKIVKVGILGLNNPNVPNWDVPSNYPGLAFADLENTDTKLSFEVDKWVPKMKEDGADVIIVSAHSGAEKDLDSTNNRDQVRDMIVNTDGVDLVVNGHDHNEYIKTQVNKNGEEIQIINGGGRSIAKAVIKLNIDSSNKKTINNIKTSLIKLDESIIADEAVESAMKVYYDEAVEYVNQPLGTVEGEWDAYRGDDHLVRQTNTLDLIHRAQIDATKHSEKGPAIVSMTLPPMNGDYAPKAGSISLKDIYDLYRYDNTLYMVEMTGAQLKSWMSATADKYSVEDGEAFRTKSEGKSGVDTFYGVNYEYHLWKDKSERLGKVTLEDGTEVTDDMVIPVALNNYRISGEYGFKEATGITEADAVWSAVKDLGDDRGQVRILIGEFIKSEGTIKPESPTNWEILIEEK